METREDNDVRAQLDRAIEQAMNSRRGPIRGNDEDSDESNDWSDNENLTVPENRNNDMSTVSLPPLDDSLLGHEFVSGSSSYLRSKEPKTSDPRVALGMLKELDYPVFNCFKCLDEGSTNAEELSKTVENLSNSLSISFLDSKPDLQEELYDIYYSIQKKSLYEIRVIPSVFAKNRPFGLSLLGVYRNFKKMSDDEIANREVYRALHIEKKYQKSIDIKSIDINKLGQEIREMNEWFENLKQTQSKKALLNDKFRKGVPPLVKLARVVYKEIERAHNNFLNINFVKSLLLNQTSSLQLGTIAETNAKIIPSYTNDMIPHMPLPPGPPLQHNFLQENKIAQPQASTFNNDQVQPLPSEVQILREQLFVAEAQVQQLQAQLAAAPQLQQLVQEQQQRQQLQQQLNALQGQARQLAVVEAQRLQPVPIVNPAVHFQFVQPAAQQVVPPAPLPILQPQTRLQEPFSILSVMEKKRR